MSRRNKSTAATTPQANAAPAALADHVATLLGSSVLPSLVDIGAEAPVQLGEIVMAAHAESGLTVEAWNALPDADREERLANAVEAMKAAVAAGATPNSNTASGSPAPANLAAVPKGDAANGETDPATSGASAGPIVVKTPVVEGETVTAFLNSPVRFGGKRHAPGRPVAMPATLFAELQAKGLIEEDD